MSSPKLSVAASGYGGRGYKAIFEEDQPVVMSVTTATGVLEKPGVSRWQREQIAAFAVTHVDEILNRSEEVGYRYLMAVPKFLTPQKVDELGPEVDVWNAAEYALDETADAGTWMHTYIEDDLLGNFTEEPVRQDHYEMVEAWHAWRSQHDIRVIATEFTVFGDRWAGTGDWILEIDGVITLGDNKTSAGVRESHIAQLGALGSAHTWAREVPEGTPGAVYHKIQPSVAKEHAGQVDSWWVPDVLPSFQRYGVLQIRPHDFDNKGTYIEPFVKFHEISQERIEAGFELFLSARDARLAQRKLKDLEKEEESDDD